MTYTKNTHQLRCTGTHHNKTDSNYFSYKGFFVSPSMMAKFTQIAPKMMRTHNQCHTKRFFLPYYRYFFSLNPNIFLDILWSGHDCRRCYAPYSHRDTIIICGKWWSRTNPRKGFHTSWRHDRIPKSGIVNNITWVWYYHQMWYRSITPWVVIRFPRSGNILTESHISVSQPCRRTHWQSKLAYLRVALLNDLAGQ